MGLHKSYFLLVSTLWFVNGMLFMVAPKFAAELYFANKNYPYSPELESVIRILGAVLFAGSALWCTADPAKQASSAAMGTLVIGGVLGYSIFIQKLTSVFPTAAYPALYAVGAAMLLSGFGAEKPKRS